MKLIKFAFIVISVILLPVLLNSHQEPVGVRVNKVYGEVQIQRPGQTEWSVPVPGEVLKQDYLVRTGANSYAELELDPANRFRLKENSQIMIKELAREAKDVDGAVVKLTEFNLLEGDVVFKLDQLPKDTLIRVTSPTAVAGTRGTAFRVRYNPAIELTRVGVLEGNVRVASVGEPGKFTMVPAYKKVTVTPWAMAVATVSGTGVLSEKILGEMAVEKANAPIIQAIGRGDTEEKAKDDAYYALARWISGIPIGPEIRVEDILNRDPSLCQPLYAYIAKAETISTRTVDNKVEVTLQLSLAPIADIIKHPLPPMPTVVKPITMKEYADKFGALARVTTTRAAQMDGYRKLAEAMYGTMISSTTTLRDYAVADDRITTTVEGVVKGAEIIDTRYFSDGSITVAMTIRAELVRADVARFTGDIFGLNYFTSPTIIDMEDFMGGEWKW